MIFQMQLDGDLTWVLHYITITGSMSFPYAKYLCYYCDATMPDTLLQPLVAAGSPRAVLTRGCNLVSGPTWTQNTGSIP